jgi:hypothetical protein
MRAAAPRALLLGIAISAASVGSSQGAGMAATPTCTIDGFCYCSGMGFAADIQRNVEAIREMVAFQKAQGKAVGYLSVPLSTVAGSYMEVNVQVAREVKERVEAQLGARRSWLLNPGAKEFSLSHGAGGAEYMLMWTQVLEGADGLGAFDFVYFVGPSDFARHFGLDGQADLEKLEIAYDNLAKADPGLSTAVDKKAFRDYYALRASVAFSFGSHDEWNIVRAINERRRADSGLGIAKQMCVFFDGKPVAAGLLETGVAPGNVGPCKN